MAIQGRKFSGSSGYRYWFNGKENDKETVGIGEGTQDFGERIYNPALGRFLSTDPLTKISPFSTPYQFAGNTPIQAIDKNGEYIYYVYLDEKTGEKIVIKITKENFGKVPSMTILAESPSGMKIINEYINNNEHDVYMATRSDLDESHDGGQHLSIKSVANFTDEDGSFNIDKHGRVAYSGLIKFSIFDKMKFRKESKTNGLIILDDEIRFNVLTNQNEENTPQQMARAIAHELYHDLFDIQGPESGEDQHTKMNPILDKITDELNNIKQKKESNIQEK